MMTSKLEQFPSWTWLRGRIPLLLALPDLLVLCGGLLLGYRIRFGEWLWPHTTEWGVASLLVLGVYGGALVASGVYRLSPRLMHLSEFMRVGTWLIGAWGLSIPLTYAVDPADVPPRGVMAVLGLAALVGAPARTPRTPMRAASPSTAITPRGGTSAGSTA